ncbi:hypothetical protein H4R34_000256 [Dimargaris verticillata]|uniref:Nucleolar 27S pre-rRNA processing Urb2/Npa2 C-terminal domain-containing protein n=1 Tax=Dimargaris verticillata TaxID=2761393 RepID=A0A9W8EFK4_9FUNG|nr:hypothetical protein H4R34_000256 [Dimargaris verticillata]
MPWDAFDTSEKVARALVQGGHSTRPRSGRNRKRKAPEGTAETPVLSVTEKLALVRHILEHDDLFFPQKHLFFLEWISGNLARESKEGPQQQAVSQSLCLEPESWRLMTDIFHGLVYDGVHTPWHTANAVEHDANAATRPAVKNHTLSTHIQAHILPAFVLTIQCMAETMTNDWDRLGQLTQALYQCWAVLSDTDLSLMYKAAFDGLPPLVHGVCQLLTMVLTQPPSMPSLSHVPAADTMLTATAFRWAIAVLTLFHQAMVESNRHKRNYSAIVDDLLPPYGKILVITETTIRSNDLVLQPLFSELTTLVNRCCFTGLFPMEHMFNYVVTLRTNRSAYGPKAVAYECTDILPAGRRGADHNETVTKKDANYCQALFDKLRTMLTSSELDVVRQALTLLPIVLDLGLTQLQAKVVEVKRIGTMRKSVNVEDELLWTGMVFVYSTAFFAMAVEPLYSHAHPNSTSVLTAQQMVKNNPAVLYTLQAVARVMDVMMAQKALHPGGSFTYRSQLAYLVPLLDPVLDILAYISRAPDAETSACISGAALTVINAYAQLDHDTVDANLPVILQYAMTTTVSQGKTAAGALLVTLFTAYAKSRHMDVFFQHVITAITTAQQDLTAATQSAWLDDRVLQALMGCITRYVPFTQFQLLLGILTSALATTFIPVSAVCETSSLTSPEPSTKRLKPDPQSTRSSAPLTGLPVLTLLICYFLRSLEPRTSQQRAIWNEKLTALYPALVEPLLFGAAESSNTASVARVFSGLLLHMTLWEVCVEYRTPLLTVDWLDRVWHAVAKLAWADPRTTVALVTATYQHVVYLCSQPAFYAQVAAMKSSLTADAALDNAFTRMQSRVQECVALVDWADVASVTSYAQWNRHPFSVDATNRDLALWHIVAFQYLDVTCLLTADAPIVKNVIDTVFGQFTCNDSNLLGGPAAPTASIGAAPVTFKSMVTALMRSANFYELPAIRDGFIPVFLKHFSHHWSKLLAVIAEPDTMVHTHASQLLPWFESTAETSNSQIGLSSLQALKAILTTTDLLPPSASRARPAAFTAGPSTLPPQLLVACRRLNTAFETLLLLPSEYLTASPLQTDRLVASGYCFQWALARVRQRFTQPSAQSAFRLIWQQGQRVLDQLLRNALETHPTNSAMLGDADVLMAQVTESMSLNSEFLELTGFTPMAAFTPTLVATTSLSPSSAKGPSILASRCQVIGEMVKFMVTARHGTTTPQGNAIANQLQYLTDRLAVNASNLLSNPEVAASKLSLTNLPEYNTAAVQLYTSTMQAITDVAKQAALTAATTTRALKSIGGTIATNVKSVHEFTALHLHQWTQWVAAADVPTITGEQLKSLHLTLELYAGTLCVQSACQLRNCRAPAIADLLALSSHALRAVGLIPTVEQSLNSQPAAALAMAWSATTKTIIQLFIDVMPEFAAHWQAQSNQHALAPSMILASHIVAYLRMMILAAGGRIEATLVGFRDTVMTNFIQDCDSAALTAVIVYVVNRLNKLARTTSDKASSSITTQLTATVVDQPSRSTHAYVQALLLVLEPILRHPYKQKAGNPLPGTFKDVIGAIRSTLQTFAYQNVVLACLTCLRWLSANRSLDFPSSDMVSFMETLVTVSTFQRLLPAPGPNQLPSQWPIPSLQNEAMTSIFQTIYYILYNLIRHRQQAIMPLLSNVLACIGNLFYVFTTPSPSDQLQEDTMKLVNGNPGRPDDGDGIPEELEDEPADANALEVMELLDKVGRDHRKAMVTSTPMFPFMAPFRPLPAECAHNFARLLASLTNHAMGAGASGKISGIAVGSTFKANSRVMQRNTSAQYTAKAIGHQIPYLLATYLHLQTAGTSPIENQYRTILQPGLYALIGALETTEREMLLASLDFTAKSLFRDMYADYRTHHQYTGNF